MKIDTSQFLPTFKLVTTRIITMFIPSVLGALIGYFASGISYFVTLSIYSGFSSANSNQFWPLLVAAFINVLFGIPLSITISRKLFPEISSGLAAQVGINLTTGVKRAFKSFLLGLCGGITIQGLISLITAMVFFAH
jgi:hypothetical protein